MIVNASTSNMKLNVPDIRVQSPRYKKQIIKSAVGETLDAAVESSDLSFKFQKISTMKFVNPVIADVTNKKSIFNLINLKALQIGESSWSSLIYGDAYFNTRTGRIEMPNDDTLYDESCLVGGEAVEYIIKNYVTQGVVKDLIFSELYLDTNNEEGAETTIEICGETFPATGKNIANLNKFIYTNKGDLLALYKNKDLLLNSIQDTIYVLPEHFRPAALGRKNQLTIHYNKLISHNNTLSTIRRYRNINIRTMMGYYRSFYSHVIDVFRTSQVSDKSYKPLLKRLSSKEGLIRKNMIGVRCDYTARTVITVDKDMPSGYVGVPRKVAASIYENVIFRENLLDKGIKQDTIGNYLANKTLTEIEQDADMLNGCPVLIGRQPTLFYLGIQLRKIKIVEGLAMVMSPLDIVAFGADFDGDAMHITAITDAKRVRDASNVPEQDGEEFIWTSDDAKPFDNLIALFYPKDGKPTIDFRHEVLYGLTKAIDGSIDDSVKPNNYPSSISDYDDIDTLLDMLENNDISPTVNLGSYTVAQGIIGFCLNMSESEYGSIKVNAKGKYNFTGNLANLLRSTEYINGATPIDWYRYSVNVLMKMGFAIAKNYSPNIDLLDDEEVFKSNGDYKSKIKEIRENIYKVQKSSLYASTDKSRVKDAYKSIEKIDKNIQDTMSNDWTDIIRSGARGKMINIQQTFLNKGTIGHCSDSIRTNAVLSNYADGLSCFESFIAANGGRADLIAKNISAAGPGYLARLMAYNATDIYINGDDCGTELTFDFSAQDILDTQEHIKHAISDDGTKHFSSDSKESLEKFMKAFLIGRYIRKGSSDVKVTKDNFDSILNEFISGEVIHLYSPIFCSNRCCKKCYGDDIRNVNDFGNGTKIGLISSQAVAEPMTQMTMKLFQTGGVERSGDLDSDIDKVLSLFSAVKSNVNEEVKKSDESIEDDEQSEVRSNFSYKDIILRTLRVINIYWKNEHEVNMKYIEVVMSSFIKFVDAHDVGPAFIRRRNASDLMMFFGIKRVSQKSSNFIHRIALENLGSSISSSLLYDNLDDESIIERELFGLV